MKNDVPENGEKELKKQKKLNIEISDRNSNINTETDQRRKRLNRLNSC